MPRNRRGRLAAAVLTALVLAASCGGGGGGDEEADDTATDGTTTTSSTTTTTTVAEGPFAPFTGEEIADPALLDQPAVIVKIGNNHRRVDQSDLALVGLDSADVVIEERIEDEATRFFAIFHSDLPDEVGSVRSARSSDIPLLSAFGNPLLVYSGANGGVQGQLNRAATQGKVVLVVDDGYGINLYRDEEFRPPANLFADPAFVLDKFGDQSGTPSPIVSFATPSADQRPASEPGPGVNVSGQSEVSFVYVPGAGYVRVRDGEIHATRDGEPLVVDNLLILETRYVQSQIYADSVDAITTAWGRATVLIDGEMWVGTWERPDRTDQYRIIHPDGSEILLDPGKTWITLAEAGSYDFEIDPEIAEVAAAVDG